MSSDNPVEENLLSVPTEVVTKRKSIMDKIKEKQTDQDFTQKISVGITLLLELYRVLMGAMLIPLVPQNCNGEICSMNENISRSDTMSVTSLSLNFVTLASFLVLYFIEVKRENKMINYLEVNRFTPVDNDSVGECLEKLPTNKRQALLQYDSYYQKAGYISTIAFVLNAVFSIISIYNHYLDDKTLTVLLTNLLFMGSKVSDVFSTVNTKKNVFYSAYLKDKVQYNDVDPDKVELLDIDGEPCVPELPNDDEEDDHIFTVKDSVDSTPNPDIVAAADSGDNSV
jgi:hypothetical protein